MESILQNQTFKIFYLQLLFSIGFELILSLVLHYDFLFEEVGFNGRRFKHDITESLKRFLHFIFHEYSLRLTFNKFYSFESLKVVSITSRSNWFLVETFV